jgi:hypothetical protein
MGTWPLVGFCGTVSTESTGATEAVHGTWPLVGFCGMVSTGSTESTGAGHGDLASDRLLWRGMVDSEDSDRRRSRLTSRRA